MTEKIDVTRRLLEESNNLMDDVETHKMGSDLITGGRFQNHDDRSDYMNDVGRYGEEKVTDRMADNRSGAPTMPYQNDERTRVFRPNKTIETENIEASTRTAATEQTDHMNDPVVGWVVVVEGPGKGAALPLGYGMNTIGRTNCRVTLNFGDMEISREPHANITYDPRGRCYYVNHGGGKNLTYLNDVPVLQPALLHGGEVINLGETALKFVPFCGKEFDWQDLS